MAFVAEKSFRRGSMRANIYVTRVTLRFLRVPEMPTSEQPVANIYGEHRRIDGVSAFVLQQRQISLDRPLTQPPPPPPPLPPMGEKGGKNRWKNR